MMKSVRAHTHIEQSSTKNKHKQIQETLLDEEIIYKGRRKIFMKIKDMLTSYEKSILIRNFKKTNPNKKY